MVFLAVTVAKKPQQFESTTPVRSHKLQGVDLYEPWVFAAPADPGGTAVMQDRRVVVETVTAYRDMPTLEQAQEWRAGLATHYERLLLELDQLLRLCQEPT